MKIVILTQPLLTNFGGILQNYALQAVLKKLGHNPITIDYARVYPKWRWVFGCLKSVLMGHKHPVQFPYYGRAGQENLNRFIHQNINMTKPVNTPLEGWGLLRKVWNGSEPEAVVVGSDQVWSPWANVPIDFLGNMFLDFVPDFKGKRVAYAASFGGGEWTYTPEWTEKCSRLAKKFDAISVREESGVKLCKEHLGVEAKHVLDPTLLLTAEDYVKLLPTSQVQSDYLFAYILDASAEKKIFLQEVAEKLGLRLVIKGANDDLKWEDSIEGWLLDIKNAAFVVTDSFHGSVFSIQFHRPFLSIINNKRGADRFTSLLGKLGLLDRLINETAKIEDISNEINWQTVENRLNVEREVSMNYLKEAL